jgi:predicted SprT family Zn-dependent metalloprotease
MAMLNPTKQTYSEFQKAYDVFNRRLFKGKLPACLITLQRERAAYGYFSGDRFESRNGETTDEIALNPVKFKTQPIEEVLSTLVHEMVHLWQHHFGKPGRGRYHNREWAEKMEEVGLCPSHTGKPGGKKTGDHMSDYIVKGGRFDKVTAELLRQGYSVSWMDRFDRQRAGGNRSNREKYTCRKCGLNAWARPGAKLMCGECKVGLRRRR